jgi:hypothetical protein
MNGLVSVAAALQMEMLVSRTCANADLANFSAITDEIDDDLQWVLLTISTPHGSRQLRLGPGAQSPANGADLIIRTVKELKDAESRSSACDR